MQAHERSIMQVQHTALRGRLSMLIDHGRRSAWSRGQSRPQSPRANPRWSVALLAALRHILLMALPRLAWLALLALPSCGVFRPHQEKMLKIDTVPSGAKVNLNGLLVGTTPCTLVLPRSGTGWLEFEVLPPPESTERLWTQRRTLSWKLLPDEGAALYFDMRLESVLPVQPYEIRDR
jgi:hypothetical protein